MKRKVLFLAVLAFLAVMLTPQMSRAFGFEAGVGSGSQDPSGEIAYKPLSSTDELDLENDFGFKKESKVFGRVKAEMPSFLPNLYLMATPMKFEGTGSKDANFTFGDKEFDVSFPFTSKLEMNMYDICLFYSLPFLETATSGVLNAELGLNARIIEFKAEVTGTVGGVTETESESATLPVPMVYAGLQINPIEKLSLEAEFRGIAYQSSHYYDFIGRVKVKPFGPLFIAGGYRTNDLKIDHDDVKASMKFSGPFFEGGVFF